MTRPKYVASCSGGKDSVATLLLAAQHNEPLDEAVFSEVMFDELEAREPDHFAVKQYRKYKLAAGKTTSSFPARKRSSPRELQRSCWTRAGAE